MTITQQPSPDWNMVTLKWAATNLDGTPATGTIDVIYNSLQPMLDDDPVTPVSIYPKLLRAPLTKTTIPIWEGAYDGDGKPIPGTGDFVAREVGYLELRVPASNDPDIIGSGGTYSFNENLNGVQGRRAVTFVADKDAPGGVIWLNRLPGATPAPAEPYSVVYWDTFYALQQQVDQLGDFEVPDATTTKAGIVRRATAAEVDAGDDVTAFVTPGRLNARLARKADLDQDGKLPGEQLPDNITVPDATTTEPGKVQLAATAANTDRVPLVALVLALIATAKSEVKTEILNGAPGALDTLDELAAALGDDSNFAATVTNALAGKQASIAGLSTAALTTLRGVLGVTSHTCAYTGTAWPAIPAGTWQVVYYVSTGHPDAPPPPGRGSAPNNDLWFDYETA